MRGSKVTQMMVNKFLNWDYYSSPVTEGRILIIWRRVFVKVTVLEETSQYVHSNIKMAGQKFPFSATFVYARNTIEERKILWKSLPKSSAAAWVMLGDFNAIFTAKDRNGGKPVPKTELLDSSQWFASSQLNVLKQTGSFFTWTNNQDGHARIYSKIDHVFVNEDWLDLFPNTTAVFNWETVSDHCSCTLSIQAMEHLGVKLFRYYNFWADHKDFKEVALDNWRKPIQGTGLKAIYLKTMWLKHKLKRFNRDHIGDIGVQFQKAKDDFQAALFHAQQYPRDFTLQDKVKVAAEAFIIQEQMYHSFLDQRSKINWFGKGDSNTAYFHACLKKRKEENRIASYVTEQGDEICRAVGQFFESGSIPEELLNTTLSLVPKSDNPSRDVDYRPIACCCTIYKCISKLLCYRLAKVLPVLVQSNQGAFVQGRSIAHNILIFQDLIKNYGRSAISPRCAIKIDISKAYDTVDWWFIEDLLKALRFPVRFISWIMTCLKNTSYFLLMNGRVQGKFKGEKGLRQGDPISPLLFVLIMEYLTRSLQLAALDTSFRYDPMCKILNLLSLCFADDLLLFCKGSLAVVQVLKGTLEEFSFVTGLQINASKSHVYFGGGGGGGVSAEDRQTLAAELQLSKGSFPLKYNGVPTRPTKWKHEDCDILIQKFRMRLHTWASRHLSFAGRILLIHSVLFGLQNYWMSIFILPQSIIKEIEKLCHGFLWGVNGNRRKIHMASWSKVCLPKVYGGLRFRNGLVWNRAILAKYIWVITEKHDVLWVKEHFSYEEVKAAGSLGKFHPSKLYNSSLCQQQIDYHRAIWCRLSIPKHRFLLWQTVNSQLLTCDNLLKLCMALDSLLCPVCGISTKNHAHLYFDCYLSRQILVIIFGWLGFQAWPSKFTSWLVWLSSRNPGIIFDIINSVLAAIVYGIWRNRNRCVFYRYSWSADSIASEIKTKIQYRILNVKNRKLSIQEQRFIDKITM
ncbi:uncharacterized protein LOC133779116 [Humulus lupulus]|uniref:uncharacterized protein LOC133779116 n=1 Tax=Humulus lupulus TaxID=3486 RepID=UPI002B40DE3B|nr:uncharacterized protein LOC133779116 [Humulus lupulus]